MDVHHVEASCPLNDPVAKASAGPAKEGGNKRDSDELAIAQSDVDI